MPRCNVCHEKYYYASEVDPPESCMCGMEFGYNLWVDSGSLREYAQLKWLQLRWKASKWLWKIAEWFTPEV